MIKVGEILKKDRLSKNLNIDSISYELKISMDILNKIENDELKKDADTIFYIGHIRSYSNYLGLNTPEIVEIFKNQISFKRDLGSEVISKPFNDNSNFKFQKIFAAALVFSILSTFYFLFVNESNFRTEFALIPDLPESYIPLIEENDLNAHKTKTVTEKNVNNLIEPNSSSAVASNEISSSNDAIITLKLLNPTWIQIRDSSDRIVLSKLMEKNEEFSYNLELDYNITAGNAGNILVFIENNLRGKIGKYGEVLDSFKLDNKFNNQ